MKRVLLKGLTVMVGLMLMLAAPGLVWADYSLSVKLTWNDNNDIDLMVGCPDGGTSLYPTDGSYCGGTYSADDQGECGPGDGEGPETFDYTGNKEDAMWEFGVRGYASCGDSGSTSDYTLEVNAVTDSGSISINSESFETDAYSPDGTDLTVADHGTISSVQGSLIRAKRGDVSTMLLLNSSALDEFVGCKVFRAPEKASPEKDWVKVNDRLIVPQKSHTVTIIDELPEAQESVYYRLKLINKDGSSELTDWIKPEEAS